MEEAGNTEEEAAKVAAVGIVMEVSSESGAGLTLKDHGGDSLGKKGPVWRRGYMHQP